MKMKKIAAAMIVAVATMAFTACGGNGTQTPTQAPESPKASTPATEVPASTEAPASTGAADGNISGTIVITGSTSVEKILNAMKDDFTAQNPDVTINYTGTGSSAGISDTVSGANTIGAASREVNEQETSQGVQQVVFAHDGIAVAVNPKNPIADIKLEQLAQIYSGQITNWKELGGNDAPIVVVSREEASGTRSAFEELTKLDDAGGLSTDATVVEGNGNIQTTVAGNENAIGYISFSYIDETVKALTVDGKEPTAENAKSGTYSLSRPFLFTYTEAGITPEAKAFLDYAVSDQGQAFVEEHGGIKVN